MSAGFKFDAEGLLNGLFGLEDKSGAAIRMYADTAALKLQNSARQNAPWTDRTAQARQRLTGDSIPVAKGYKLRLAQGVDYGIFLELAHEKRFAIIMPTIDKESNNIMQGFNGLMERLK